MRGLPPLPFLQLRPHVDPELTARYSTPQTFRERFAGTLVGLGIAVALLIGLSIVGRFL